LGIHRSRAPLRRDEPQSNLAASVSNFGFSIPIPAVGHVFSGFQFLGVILVTAIPFGIYDLVEAMDNVESAAVAGRQLSNDASALRRRGRQLDRLHDGKPVHQRGLHRSSRVEGHGRPDWVFRRHGRHSDPARVAGIIAVMAALIPVVAISPILLYIGMLIGSQAFQENPKSHAPAIVLALTPHLAAWGKLQIDNSLGAAGTNAAAVGFDKLGQTGVLYQGLATLGGGAILAGLILGAIGVFIIERQFMKSAAFALAGAVLTFFGFMHGEAIGIGQTPLVALSYLAVAGILLGCAKFASVSALPPVRWITPSRAGGGSKALKIIGHGSFEEEPTDRELLAPGFPAESREREVAPPSHGRPRCRLDEGGSHTARCRLTRLSESSLMAPAATIAPRSIRKKRSPTRRAKGSFCSTSTTDIFSSV
jgi:hypothetical protein